MTASNKAVLPIENCMDCPNHVVVNDPDPHDWFNDDDEAVLCKISPNVSNAERYAGGKFPHRPVSISIRPYNKRKECTVPDWCPLLEKK